MRKPKAALVALLVTGALVGGCATGDDAVVVGPETFEFVSPDGQLNTFEPLATFSAVQLMSADRPALLRVVDDVARAALTTGEETVLLTFDDGLRSAYG